VQESNVGFITLGTADLKKLRTLDIEMFEGFLPNVRETIISKPGDNSFQGPLQIVRRRRNV